MLVCDLVILELVRLAPNEERARELARRLAAVREALDACIVVEPGAEVQLAMAASGDHRRVPPPGLLIAATAELAKVPLVDYDRDYERIAAVTAQEHVWFVAYGALTGAP